MRLGTTDAAALGALLSGAVVWEPVVSSWLGGSWLANVPVDSGTVTWSTGRDVPGSLDLTVPRVHGGRDWRPGLDDDHPLAAKGQVLHVAVRVSSVSGAQSWVIPWGQFMITKAEPDAGAVRVAGVSMTERLVRARLRTPTAPRTGGTLATELRRLLPASMGLDVDPALTDRACPDMAWGESRIGAVQEIAAAWPARLREDAHGGMRALPPLDGVPDPVDTLTDGVGGTVVGAYESDDSSGVTNVVVARGQETDEAGRPTFQAEAEQTTGPFAVDRFGESVAFFASPLIDSPVAAQAAASTRLASLTRAARTIPVTLAPDPRWDLDDAVEVLADGQRWWGWVSGLTLPLTTDGGDMRMDVEVP